MPLQLTWTGHATWFIDTGSGVLLIDPFFDDCPTASMKAKDVSCDAILITHGHFDHVADLVTIAQRTKAPVFCNWEIAQWLGKQGVENVRPMNLGGREGIPGGTAKMEIAHHSSSLPDGTYGGVAAGWVLEIDGMRAYYAGDTALFGDMARIGRSAATGRRLDVAILPIGDHFTMGPRRLSGGHSFARASRGAAEPLRYVAGDRTRCACLGKTSQRSTASSCESACSRRYDHDRKSLEILAQAVLR